MKILRGRVIRSQSGFYSVETEGGLLLCRLRGRLKQGPKTEDIVAVGDWVQVTHLGKERGVIEIVEPRERMLSRMAPTPRGEYQQIIIANPDQAVLVFACTQPEPKLRMLDRFLVIADVEKIPALIVANKIDLVSRRVAMALFDRYRAIGYPLVYTSAKTGKGVNELKNWLKDRVSVLIGPSGVGKSSLLNAIQPDLGLTVKRVSSATSKGRHATSVRQLIPLDCGGYVADTPGLKALALWDIEPSELDGYFPELRPLVVNCQFSDCTHLHEPGCAVQAALEAGEIHPDRYESYVRMRLGEEESV
ncbi:MAG: ribosome small subunit-dependent GTPase A [Chloroflexota bacterium]